MNIVVMFVMTIFSYYNIVLTLVSWCY